MRLFRTARARVVVSVGLVLFAAACAPGSGREAGPGERTAYLEDRAFRRTVLEDALWRPELPYARGLLSAYALPETEGGWERLPLQDTRSAPFRVEDGETLARGGALTLDDATSCAVPASPDSADAGEDDAAWQALGAEVFARLPMRSDAWLDDLAARPDRWEAAGLAVDASGRVRGLVRFADRRGRVRVGLTCAGCHAGDGIPGRGDRRLDLGRARALFASDRGLDAGALVSWGPGRVDVTDTDSDDPTAIPDLFHVGEAAWLNHSGVVRVGGPATLAVRFETQFIQGHRMQSRPPRPLMWALARFVASLGEADPVAPPPTPLFEARCAGCHAPERAYGGDLVEAEALAVDPAVARDPERGTGHYKVPSLRGVATNAPYLHDGSAPDLEAVLAAGHPAGAVLPAAERAALVAFLKTL